MPRSRSRPASAPTYFPASTAPTNTAPSIRPFAVVLAGGGARGLAHAGALRALQHDGYRPSALVGVSMGAIVAATYALNPTWYEDLLALDTRRLPEPLTPQSHDALERCRVLLATGERFVRGLLLGWQGDERMRDHALDILTHLTRGRSLEEADPPVTVVATDLNTGERVALNSGPAAPAVYASAALAGVLPPAELYGRLLADGGYADLAPVDLARDHGVDRVLAVDPYQDTVRRPPRTGLETMLRAMEICHNRHASLRFALADIVVRPAFPFQIDTLEFRALRSAIAAGARAVVQARQAIRQALLYPTHEGLAPAFSSETSPRKDSIMPISNNCHGGSRTAERDDCYVAPLDKAVDPGHIADGAEARLLLAGLGCPNCAARVRNAILALDGVIAVDVSLEPQRAVAIYDPTRTLPDHLVEAVHRAGAASHHAYRAEIVEVRSFTATLAHTHGNA